MQQNLITSPLTFQDLHFCYCTGRSFLLSGSGRNKTFGYRHGVMCALGDIEQTEWVQLMHQLIDKTGEQQLYEQLLQWYTDHNYAHSSRSELGMEALQAHSHRLFDCERWVDYVPFNRRFRPEVLARTKLALIQCCCCEEPGLTTQAQLDSAHNGTVCCPVCGRWSAYHIITNTKEAHSICRLVNCLPHSRVILIFRSM